jgi:hypothetical protein
MSKFSAESKSSVKRYDFKRLFQKESGEKWNNVPFFVSMNKYLLYQHQLDRP